MSAEAVRIVERIQAVLVGTDVVAAVDDEEAHLEVRSMFGELAAPDFEVVMVGPDYTPARRETTGADGFRDVWREWTSPFEEFRIELDDVIDAGELVVSLVRQVGKTKTGGVEIDTTAAAVWTVRAGKLQRVEFHLDQEAALRAAGIPPGTS
jgi:ketosteroid isomerase-like protein